MDAEKEAGLPLLLLPSRNVAPERQGAFPPTPPKELLVLLDGAGGRRDD